MEDHILPSTNTWMYMYLGSKVKQQMVELRPGIAKMVSILHS